MIPNLSLPIITLRSNDPAWWNLGLQGGANECDFVNARNPYCAKRILPTEVVFREKPTKHCRGFSWSSWRFGQHATEKSASVVWFASFSYFESLAIQTDATWIWPGVVRESNIWAFLIDNLWESPESLNRLVVVNRIMSLYWPVLRKSCRKTSPYKLCERRWSLLVIRIANQRLAT